MRPSVTIYGVVLTRPQQYELTMQLAGTVIYLATTTVVW